MRSSFASSVVRYLGDRPRWLRYRLCLADSDDVSYRGFPEITVLRFVRDVWTFLKDSEANGCVKQCSAALIFDCSTLTRLVPDQLLLADTLRVLLLTRGHPFYNRIVTHRY